MINLRITYYYFWRTPLLPLLFLQAVGQKINIWNVPLWIDHQEILVQRELTMTFRFMVAMWNLCVYPLSSNIWQFTLMSNC